MKKTISLLATLAISASAFAFTGDNDPKFILGKNYNAKFNQMPLESSLDSEQTPWASSFWPNIYGGIAFRWNGYYVDAPEVRKLQHEIGGLKTEILELKHELFKGNPSSTEIYSIKDKIQNNKNAIANLLKIKGAAHKTYFYDIKRPKSLAEVRAMSQEQIDMLSPAEKYDIYVALKTGRDLSLRLTNNVLNAAGPFEAYWEGICHGWSSASIEFHEPKVQKYTKDGITINFGSSDFKGLLSYYHAAITKNPTLGRKVVTGRVGERCETEFPAEAWFIKNGKEYYKWIEGGKVVVKEVPENCVDTNPGAFHIVLANQIANKKQGFVAEAVRDKEVWNQPVFAYKTEVVNETTNIDAYATPKTRKQVTVKTRMHYGNDGGRMFWQQNELEEEFYAWWNPTNGTSNYRSAHKDFEYILDLDKRGNIIGGRWLSYERPDFIWLKKSKGFVTRGLFLGIVGYMRHLQDFVTVR